MAAFAAFLEQRGRQAAVIRLPLGQGRDKSGKAVPLAALHPVEDRHLGDAAVGMHAVEAPGQGFGYVSGSPPQSQQPAFGTGKPGPP